MAVEAGANAHEKDKEYQEARAELKEAKEQAYGDDAMFDAYTADLQYDSAINSLKNNSTGNTGNYTGK